ncbi:RbsD/FucU domain-containing protein [Paramuribaculum intestinale]|uniref:RbsD/FucU domain-containing protein n=1 Tax=Paramuribaculum intestinale TaxID=2094151 RepID=UPI000FFF20D1|nr:RbsD/FucU domain-containing protein [Paramuribaculum intestinale]RXE61918.1 hypothetical protein ED375_07630 [Muribaculaceae bacterium Isolate-004 (NCI)]
MDWKEQLHTMMPLLGHRNWIVVTDMAYPLQTNPGVLTLDATADDFPTVLRTIRGELDSASHVVAHVYRDSEQLRLDERLCPGITSYRAGVDEVIGGYGAVKDLGHEDLILRLDEVSRLYRVVVIKSGLTIPYTSLFFELDCRYWDADREAAIRS